MKWGKWLTAWILVGIIFSIYDYLIHGTLMAKTYESVTIFTAPPLPTGIILAILVDFLQALLFTLLYAVTWKSFRSGLEGGVQFGLLTSLLVFVPSNLFILLYTDHTQFPIIIPRWWILFGIIQYVIGGAIAALVFREKQAS